MSLIAALFPKQGDLDGVERLALSFGLSIAVTPLIGLVLNYTSYGIRLDPILLSLSSLTVLLVVVAYLRRRLTASESRFRVDFGGFFKSLGGGFSGESRTGKILSVILNLSVYWWRCLLRFMLWRSLRWVSLLLSFIFWVRVVWRVIIRLI